MGWILCCTPPPTPGHCLLIHCPLLPPSSTRKGGEDATLLDMGEYVFMPKTQPMSVVLSPEFLGLEHLSAGLFSRDSFTPTKHFASASGPQHKAQPSLLMHRRSHVPATGSIRQHGGGPMSRSMSAIASAGRGAGASPLGQRLRMYQVLSPCQVGRGQVFGSKLVLKEEWTQLDAPYFSAPGMIPGHMCGSH